VIGLTTPGAHPVWFITRPGTSDGDVAVAINVWDGVVNDEYRMTGRKLSGWAMDVGAHIGALTVALALDHPDLRVVAVEAVPDNANLLRQNAEYNGVADRVEVVNAFAAAPGTLRGMCNYGYRHTADTADSYVSAHRFIGGTWDVSADGGSPEFAVDTVAVSLDSLLERFGIDELELLKIDCEGCEWQFLDTPAVAKIKTIVGEYHGRPSEVDPRRRLEEMLGATHHVIPWSDDAYDIGSFEAVRRD
jgi:FkbM family methyltransferase